MPPATTSLSPSPMPSAMSARSWPEEKPRPAPVSTTTRMVRSTPISLSRAYSSCINDGVMALSVAGRFSVTSATSGRTSSTSTSSVIRALCAEPSAPGLLGERGQPPCGGSRVARHLRPGEAPWQPTGRRDDRRLTARVVDGLVFVLLAVELCEESGVRPRQIDASDELIVAVVHDVLADR